jgi:hypothetical protein
MHTDCKFLELSCFYVIKYRSTQFLLRAGCKTNMY